MATVISREELKKIANAFLNNDKRVLKLYKSGVEKDFLEYLKLKKTNYNLKPRFKLQGYPVHWVALPPYGSEIHKNVLLDAFLNKGNTILQSSMTVAISYRCSYNCEQCYISEYRDSSKKEMTVDEFKVAFNKIVNDGFVWHFDITGGEPFEHPEFFEIIKQIPADKATAIVATNGLGIDEKTVSKIKDSNIMACKVSLDLYSGFNSDSMKKALNSIEVLANNKVLSFAQIFLKRGFAEHFKLEAIIEKCRKAGAAIVHLVSPMTIGNLKNHDELLFTNAEREIIYFWQKYYWLMHRYEVMLFPDWEIFAPAGCLAAKGRIYISPYGDIYPCNFIPKSYGNILTDSLKQAILSMQNDAYSSKSCFSTNCSLNTIKQLKIANLNLHQLTRLLKQFIASTLSKEHSATRVLRIFLRGSLNLMRSAWERWKKLNKLHSA